MKASLVVPAVVLAAVLVSAPSRAPADPLDFQGLAYSSGTVCECPAYMVPSMYDRYYAPRYETPRAHSTFIYSRPTYGRPARVYSTRPTTYLYRESNPVHRHPRYHDRDRDYDREDRYEPHYFAAIGGGNFDPDNQPGNGFWGNAEIGSEAGEALDLGVRVNWYHRESDRSEVVSEFTDPAGNVGQRVIVRNNVETNVLPAMAIARIRFPLSREFQPYVGGGVGWEWLTVEGTDDQGFVFQDDYDGFGAQLFGGLNVGVGRNMGLYGEALWNKSTVKAVFFDSAVGGDVQDEINLDGLAFHGGLRFRF